MLKKEFSPKEFSPAVEQALDKAVRARLEWDKEVHADDETSPIVDQYLTEAVRLAQESGVRITNDFLEQFRWRLISAYIDEFIALGLVEVVDPALSATSSI